MPETSFEYKRAFYYLVASVFTFINLLAFLISRNNAWVRNPGRAWQYASSTEFRDYPSSEFERTLSCYGFGQCQRIGGALIIQPINFFADTISKFYFWNVDDQSRIFIIQMVGFGWRIICFLIITFLIFKSTNNLLFSTVFLNSLLFTLSGWMLRALGEMIHVFPLPMSSEFKSRSLLAFQDFPHENLQWYDFGLFAALAAIAVLISRLSLSQVSILRTVLISVLVTSFFEYLGFVLALAWILYEKSAKSSNLFSKKSLRIGTFVGLGSIIWLLLVASYRKAIEATFPKFFSTEKFSGADQVRGVFWAIQHPVENLTSNPSIPFQIVLVLSQSAFLGVLLGLIARGCFKQLNLQPSIMSIVKSITVATAVVMFINFFIAYGVEIQAGEHSRQTLGLQIALFTYSFLYTASKKRVDKFVDVAS